MIFVIFFNKDTFTHNWLLTIHLKYDNLQLTSALIIKP